MDIGIMVLSNLENPQHAYRLVPEQDVISKMNPSTANGKLADILAEQKTPAQQRASFAKIRLDGSANDACQIADIACREIIAFHETLNRAQPAPVGKTHQRSNRHLPLKIKPFLGTAGKQVEMTAHGPQKTLRGCKPACLAVPQNNLVDKIQNIICPIGEFGDPEQRMQIAQTTFALFDIGFDDIARCTKARMALVPLGEFLLDEITGLRLADNGRHSAFQLPV